MSDTKPTRGADVGSSPIGVIGKARLSALIAYDCLVVLRGLRSRRLPELVRSLQRAPRIRIAPLDPRRLGRIVARVLRIGRHAPRCIVLSLVFLRMLRRQGMGAELVIGLPPNPKSHEAHAWVEIDGKEVGPPPGRLGREALARYGEPK